MKMKSNPIGGIYTKKNTNEYQYINSTLQALSILEIIKDLFLRQNNPYISQAKLANKFLFLLNILYRTTNDGCSLDLIETFQNYAYNFKDNEALLPNPYNFLTSFLQFLDNEYNNLYYIKRELNKETFLNIDEAVNNLQTFYNSLKSSSIFNNFFFSIISENKCRLCEASKVWWSFEKVIDLNIDNYKKRKKETGPITLNECIQYYLLDDTYTCENCKKNCTQSRTFFKTGKVLIINLIREKLTGQNEVDFKIDYKISISQYKKDLNNEPQNYNFNYFLKSRIAYAGEKYGYFVDCLVKRGNMKGVWYRYVNQVKRELGHNEINEYEPIILIYESYSINNVNNNNIINNNMRNNRNYYPNNPNMLNNNMRNYNNNYNPNLMNNNRAYNNMNYNRNYNRNYNNYNNNIGNYNQNRNIPQNNNYNVNNNFNQHINNNLRNNQNQNIGNYQNNIQNNNYNNIINNVNNNNNIINNNEIKDKKIDYNDNQLNCNNINNKDKDSLNNNINNIDNNNNNKDKDSLNNNIKKIDNNNNQINNIKDIKSENVDNNKNLNLDQDNDFCLINNEIKNEDINNNNINNNQNEQNINNEINNIENQNNNSNINKVYYINNQISNEEVIKNNDLNKNNDNNNNNEKNNINNPNINDNTNIKEPTILNQEKNQDIIIEDDKIKDLIERTNTVQNRLDLLLSDEKKNEENNNESQINSQNENLSEK